MNRFAVIFSIIFILIPAVADASKILIPAYFDPGNNLNQNHWNELTAAASKAEITAIINPHNGPGTTVNNDYSSAINAFRGAGGKVIGYIDSAYGSRDINLVKADVVNYSNFYSMDGFFIDSMSNQIAQLPYYQELHAYIKNLNLNSLVFGNPGTDTLEKYLSVADVLVTFEGPLISTTNNPNCYDTYGGPSTWMQNYNSNRFGHLIYGVSDAGIMKNLVNLSTSHNAAYIFITDDTLPDPWDTLPSYWNSEIAALNIPEPSIYYLFGAGLTLMMLIRFRSTTVGNVHTECKRIT